MSNDILQYNISGLSLNEKVDFFSQLHSYLSSSIPITTALMNIQKYSNSKKIKLIAKKLLEDLDKGENFANSILKFKHSIGNVYCNLMSIGAQSGELPRILQEIHSSLKRHRTMLYNLIKASVYPAILILILIASSLLLVFFISPRMSAQYQMITGGELSQNMNAMENIANLLQNNWISLLIIFNIILWGIIRFAKYLLKSELGIVFPVIGKVIKYYNLSIFSKLLAISYAAGLPITHGILLSCESVQNEYIQKKLFKCSSYISKHSLSESFAGTGFFTPQMLSKIQAGEQTGKLDEVLHEISSEIDETLEMVLSSALRLIEPVLMLIIAGMAILYGTTMMNTLFMI